MTYDFHASLVDPNLFLIFEEWETAEALAAHSQTPHMAVFRQKLRNVVAGKGWIKRYEVASVGDL
jgi:quinol monooxygenase YgiN